MVEMPLVMMVLRASELMQPAPADGTELMEVKTLGEFLGAAFDVESPIAGKVKITSAAIRLQGYMAGSTALRRGAVWQRAADSGACTGLTAVQAGEQLRASAGLSASPPYCQRLNRRPGRSFSRRRS